MNSKVFISSVLLAASFATPVLADENEEDRKGFYASVGITNSSPDDAKAKIDDTNWDFVNGSFGMDDGTSATFGLGYDWGKFRAELSYDDVDYTINKLTGCIGGTCLSSTQIDGDKKFNATVFSLNAFYDFENTSKWTPYIGGGIGTAELRGADFTATYSGTTASLKGQTQNVTSYKGILGLTYEASKKVDIFTELAYLETEGFTSKGSGDTIALKYDPASAWSGTLGVRFRF